MVCGKPCNFWVSVRDSGDGYIVVCDGCGNTSVKEKLRVTETDKTDSNPFSDIYSLNRFPATEQFNALYEASKTVIDKILIHKGCKITEDLIQKFVKCRNEITHGNKPKLTKEIADTYYSMIVLIYVSLSKRIGLTDDEIFKSFEKAF